MKPLRRGELVAGGVDRGLSPAGLPLVSGVYKTSERKHKDRLRDAMPEEIENVPKGTEGSPEKTKKRIHEGN